MHAVRREIVILSLFAVRDDRRACGFKPLNGVSNGIFIKRIAIRILNVAPCDSLDQINGSWDTADWLGGYRDWRRLGHTYRLARSRIDLTLLGSKGFQCLHRDSLQPARSRASPCGVQRRALHPQTHGSTMRTTDNPAPSRVFRMCSRSAYFQ